MIPEASIAIGEDKKLSEVWESIRNISAPQLQLWQEIEGLKRLIKSAKANSDRPDSEGWKMEYDWEDILKEISNSLQRSVTLQGQALNKVTFLRRCNALSAIPKAENYNKVKSDIKESKDLLEKGHPGPLQTQ